MSALAHTLSFFQWLRYFILEGLSKAKCLIVVRTHLKVVQKL